MLDVGCRMSDVGNGDAGCCGVARWPLKVVEVSCGRLCCGIV